MPRQHPIQMPSGHNFYLIRVIISDSHRCARLLLCFIFVFWAKKNAHPQLANERIILYSLDGCCRWCSALHGTPQIFLVDFNQQFLNLPKVGFRRKCSLPCIILKSLFKRINKLKEFGCVRPVFTQVLAVANR